MADRWRITSARGTEDLIGGRFVPVMEYTVMTVDGATNTFRTPTAQYSAESVRATVDEWYERHAAVMGLSG
jgi:predicted nucleotide-binding protein (sugar kinase/HSP70/actin superfamily)